MKELVNFEHFKIIREAEIKLDAYLDNVVKYAINEATPAQTKVGALFQDPIKFTKIRNNAKKYQKSLVQKALNDVDFEKKKQAAGGEVDKDKIEVLAAANKAKNQALTDQASAIADRMKELATSPGLQAVKSLAISKAKVAAAETALKAADAEESKQLKIRIKSLNAQAAKAEQDLKDYEKEREEKKASQEEPQESPTKQEMPTAKEDTKPEKKAESEPNVKAIEDAKTAVDAAKAKYDQVKDGDDEGAKIDAQIAFKQAQQKKAKLENNDELFQGLGDDIGKLMIKKQELSKKPETAEEDPLDKEIKNQEDKIAAIKSKASDKNSPLANPEVLAKALEPEEKKLKELKDKKAGSNESADYIGESFTDKFRRLMKTVNV